MTGSPVLDFHAHLPAGDEARERLLEVMDACDIARAVVVAAGVVDPDQLSRQLVDGGHVEDDADNEAVLMSCKLADGRLVPFYFANPYAPADLYREQGRAFAGLKLAPGVHGMPFRDERIGALADVAGELGHPVYLHCAQLPGRQVADLVDLARRHPAVTFVLGHAGVTHVDWHAVNLVAPVDNIALETSGGYSSVTGVALRRLGPDRVLFGTEYPLQHPSVELAKLRALDLSPSTWRSVTWDNAARLIGEI